MSTSMISQESIQRAFEKFQATLSPELKQKLNGRLERGLELMRQGAVAPHSDPKQNRVYKVNSSRPGKPAYIVNLPVRSCTCPDHWKGHFCKHRIAAHLYEIAGLLEQAAQKVKAPVEPIAQPGMAVRETAPTLLSIPSPSVPVGLQSEAIVWAMLNYNGQNLGVEVLSLQDDLAVVRALPVVKDGSKIQPHFPFSGGHSSIETVAANELFHVKVFRHV